jgi:hypothetical protein
MTAVGGSAYFVGDPAQAIYRYRESGPTPQPRRTRKPRRTSPARLLKAYRDAGFPAPTIRISPDGEVIATPHGEDNGDALDARTVVADRIAQMRASKKGG